MKNIKCVMVGDGCVGKSYAEEAYNNKCFPSYFGYVPTDVFDSFYCIMDIGDEYVEMRVFDTSGLGDLDRLRISSYKEVDVVLLFYEVTSPPSYRRILEKWYPEVSRYCPLASFIVVGARIDLRKDPDTLNKLKENKLQVLTPEDGLKLARKINAATYVECSSKTLVGIDNVFETAAIVGAGVWKTWVKNSKTHGIDPALIHLIKTSKGMFNEVLNLEMEENYDIRIMAVGQAGVGKSTLTRRLLKLPVKIKEYNSTNGIEVHIHSCEIDLETGKWVYQKRGLVSNIRNILKKRQKKHESRSKTVTKQGTREFHRRCAKLLQNFQDAEGRCLEYKKEAQLLMNRTSEEIEAEMLANMIKAEKTESKVKGADQKKHEIMSEGNAETPSRNVHKSNLISIQDVDKTLETAKTIKPVKYNHTSKVSFYDFAGQDIFHASHPTFLSPKSIYALVFDLNMMYRRKRVKQERKHGRVKFFGDCRGGATLGNMEYIFFWLNVIYSFATRKDGVYPQVILVGTHRDKLPKINREQIVEECFKELRKEIVDSPMMEILSQDEVAVDNTRNTDESFYKLREEILRLAKLQPQWGQKTPAKWLPLNRDIKLLKEDGLKILSFAELEELNESLDVKVDNTDELEMFLQFQHDSGEIIWFSEKVLRSYIVLDPVWLIDALKLIITAEQFALRTPKLAEKWESFYETGVIDRTAIVSIFEENEDSTLFENHEHVLLLMEKYLFIASPVTPVDEQQHSGGTGQNDMNLSDVCTAKDVTDNLSEDGSEKEVENIWYIMPCMVHKVADCASLIATGNIGKSSMFCMVSICHFLPPAVFQKLLAICIRKWPILEQRGQKLLYCGLCKFNIDHTKNYKLLMFLVGYAIHVRIENFASEIEPPTAMCSEIRTFLTHTLRSVLLGMGFSDKFRTCIQCPLFDALENGGYFDIDFCEDKETITCDDCEPSHPVQTEDLLNSWLDKKQPDLMKVNMEKIDSFVHRSTDVEDMDNHATFDSHLAQKQLDTVASDSLTQGATDNKDLSLDAVANQNIPDALDSDSYADDSPITQDHINHARVCNALVSVCADALREILLCQVPPGFNDIYSALKANRGMLTGMRQLRKEQLSLIYPDPVYRYTGTVDQFDITILYTLIRNLSSVKAPINGWGLPPDDNPRDTSLGANVERIRSCRNKVSGHSVDGKLSDQCLETYWIEIGEMIDDIEKEIGDKGFKEALESRKKQVITPQEAKLLKIQIRSYQSQLQADMQPLAVALENVGEMFKKLKTDVDTKLC